MREPRGVYRGTAGVLRDGFLHKALTKARNYRRAAGFFSSSVFRAAPEAFYDLFATKGTMELVCSPRLPVEDVQAYADALAERPRWTRRKLQRPSGSDWEASFLAWATVHGRFFIKVAVVRDGGHLPRGLYHEKFGIVTTPNGEVGFSGSANETYAAYVHNYERVRAYDGTADRDRQYVRMLHEDFERLWQNQTPGLEVLPLHEALRRGLVELTDSGVSPAASLEQGGGLTSAVDLGEIAGESLVWPSRLQLRPYQEEAIDAWFRANGSGILAMATGSGKTITALSVATRLFERAGGPLVVIVVAPFLVLVDQWIEVMKSFALQPIRCAEAAEAWTRHAESAVRLANRGRRKVVSLVVTNQSFRKPPFQRVLDQLEVRSLLIADEVHNFGASGLLESLPEKISLRLGLSATPERKWDAEGNVGLARYFGKPVFRFSLRDAMELRPPVLTPYSYHPILVELEDDELEEYLRLSRTLARLMGSGLPDETSDQVRALLLRRARLIASARGKLDALRQVMGPLSSSRLNLVYCGDGRTETSSEEVNSDDRVERQIEAVVRLLGQDLGMRVAPYTAETSANERRELLTSFTDGALHALVAIRCLDEGVDIPDVRRAFLLASSTNPRQFIQRRGRILRRAPGKETADVYDFFVVPPIYDDKESLHTERRLVRREMERALDFLALATNATSARHKLLPILERVNSLDLLARKVDG